MSERNAERLAKLSSRTKLVEKVNWLQELGPRETGNFEHVRFINYIAEQVESFGLKVNRDSRNFDLWSVLGSGSRCALTIHGSRGVGLTVRAFYFAGYTMIIR